MPGIYRVYLTLDITPHQSAYLFSDLVYHFCHVFHSVNGMAVGEYLRRESPSSARKTPSAVQQHRRRGFFRSSYPISHKTRPYSTLATVPNTITGPATRNIFVAMPVTYPSALKSMAGETTAFAKPVMGTSVPAPP